MSRNGVNSIRILEDTLFVGIWKGKESDFGKTKSDLQGSSGTRATVVLFCLAQLAAAEGPLKTSKVTPAIVSTHSTLMRGTVG